MAAVHAAAAGGEPARKGAAGEACCSEGKTPLTDAVDQAQREFDEALATADAALKVAGEALARLRALRGRAPAASQSSRRRRKVDAQDAFRRAGFEWSDEKIQRVCRNHSNTWAIRIGTWCVYEPDFSDFVAAVESGDAKFRF